MESLSDSSCLQRLEMRAVGALRLYQSSKTALRAVQPAARVLFMLNIWPIVDVKTSMEAA